MEQQYYAGKSIYEINHEASYVCIIKEGTVIMDTCIENDTYQRYPCSTNQWKVVKETKKYQYKLQQLNKFSVFGHEEILTGRLQRCTRTIACTNVKLLVFKRSDFLRMFTEQTKQRLRENMVSIDLQTIVKRMEKQLVSLNARSKAIFHSTEINQNNLTGSRARGLLPVQEKLNKLEPWLNRAKKNFTNNQNLRHQLRKVDCLSTTQEKYIVSSDDP